MIDLDSGWLPLSDAVGRLVKRGNQEAQAKIDICAAIAEMKLRVRVYAHEGDDGGPRPAIAEVNDVEIHVELNPKRLDWPVLGLQ